MKTEIDSTDARLAGVIGMAAALIQETDLARLLDRAMDLVVALTGAEAVAICLTTPTGDRLRLAAQRGFSPSLAEEDPVLSPGGPGPISRAVATRQLQLAAKLADGERRASLPAGQGGCDARHILAAAPLQARGEMVGVLALAGSVMRRFGSAETAILEGVAGILATGVLYCQNFVEDLRLHEKMQAERSRLEAVLENSPAGVVLVEGDSGRVYANRAAQSLFGRPLDPERGREQYLGQLCHPDGTPLTIEEFPTSRALSGEAVLGAELLVRRTDGYDTPALANAAPVRDADGRITGAALILQDITPLKLERLREEFISIVAHDLRTPISVINGYADLLGELAAQRGETETGVERRALKSIRSSARRLNRMVQDLLDASRIEAHRLTLEKRPLDVLVMVGDVVERLSEILAPHPVRVEGSQAMPLVDVDPGRLEQIMTNLLTNAAKYSPPEAEILVRVESGPAEVVVSVSDLGPGIDSVDIPRLFTRFYRTPSARASGREGTGLGLYTSKGLVEAHGGRMWLQTEPGGGCTFFFSLPISTGHSA